jgi:uncharacterized protein (TIGR00730 family)
MGVMTAVRHVTVYCSSSGDLHPAHYETARRLGESLARSGRVLVYGGGCVGMMGVLARACRGAGGRVVGIITERLKRAEQLDPENDEGIVVRTMRERKALLEARGDAFVVLPGGLGTLEEFFEILVGRLLGEHDKPVLLLNPPDPDAPARGVDARFFDPLLEMFDHLVRSRFAREGITGLFRSCGSVEELMSALDAPAPALGAGGYAALMPTRPGAAGGGQEPNITNVAPARGGAAGGAG